MAVRWAVLMLVLLAIVASVWFGVRMVRGVGAVVTEGREVSGFSAVDFSGVGEMIVSQGDAEALTIEADEDLLPYIESVVQGETLVVRMQLGGWQTLLRPNPRIRYTLRVKNLSALSFSGAGQVSVAPLTTSNLSLSHSGAGAVTLSNLEAEGFDVALSGAGDVTVAGRVAWQTVNLSGLSSYRAGELESERAEIALSGAGTATLWVTEALDADLSGAGSIRYYGSPRVDQSVSGAGKVESLGSK